VVHAEAGRPRNPSGLLPPQRAEGIPTPHICEPPDGSSQRAMRRGGDDVQAAAVVVLVSGLGVAPHNGGRVTTGSGKEVVP
jgi:hypothetical protein